MSDLNAILTLEDKREFARWLFDNYQAKFVPDDDLPRVATIDDMHVLDQILGRDFPPLLFVLSNCWSTLPLHKAKATNQHKGEIHYIVQRYGGPAFTWLLGNSLTKDDRIALTASLFADYPSYYVAPGDSTTIRRPEDMTLAFRGAQKWIKALCGGTRTVWSQSGTVGPWISRRAQRLVLDGRACFAIEGIKLAQHAA